MAVEKVYRCDLCGKSVPRDLLRVARVGTPDDRPEDCERIDIGPECGGRPVEDMIAAYEKLRADG
jgi:hypothetical protein